MNKIAVITAITNGVDALRLNQAYDGADFFCFTDDLEIESGRWKLRAAHSKSRCPVRNAKIYKCLPFLFLPGYDYYVWLDGCNSLLKSVPAIIERYLDGTFDAAFFKHDRRACTYEEADQAKKYRKTRFEHDDIDNQITFYKNDGFPRWGGLYYGGFFILRNSPKIQTFCQHWWAQISAFSKRDQVSLMYSIWKTGIDVFALPGRRLGTDLIRSEKHTVPDNEQVQVQ